MQYDVWGNMTSKSGHLWRQSLSDSSTYINNRRQYWSYDAEVNLLGNDGKSHTYDAAGKQTLVASTTEIVGGSGNRHPQQPGWEIAQTYDAGGQPVKRLETRRTEEPIGDGPQTNITETVTTTYYLYSSVLGAKVVELDANGVKTKGYVYANGERLAKQEVSQWSTAVRWYYPNAGTNSWLEEMAGGGVERQEMDPMGAEVGTSDPYVNLVNPGYRDIHPLPQMLYLEGGDPFDFSGGYTLDGVPMSRSEYNRLIGRAGGMLIADFWAYHVNWRDGDRVNMTLTSLGSAMLTPLTQGQQPQHQPQNPDVVTRPIGGLDKLQAEFEKALKYSDCREALSKILAQIGSDTKFAPSHTDILDLFNALKNQTGGGGIFVDVPGERLNDFLPEQAREGKPVGGGGGLSSLFYTDRGNWRTRQRWSAVFLKSSYANTSQLNIERQPYEYVVTLIHEITHNAPNDSSWAGKNYLHAEMDAAAIKLGSTSFDQYVREHCIPKKYW